MRNTMAKSSKSDKIRVLVWNEGLHEKSEENIRKVYPKGIHSVIAEALGKNADMEITTATLETDDQHGCSEEVIKNTDVVIWWAHMAHGAVKDEVAERIQRHVNQGMGLIVLHSGHFSKPFTRLMGTTCGLTWREVDEKERIWIIEPTHPIAEGLEGEYFELAETEMYGERFDIPAPDELVFVSWYEGGEVFRSGCCWRRGYGKVFYFAPGHECYPIYYDKNIQRVITNAVRWAKPAKARIERGCPMRGEPLDPVKRKK